MCADYRVYAHISRQSRAVVASACALLAYTGAHQVENIYKDELYRIQPPDNVVSYIWYINSSTKGKSWYDMFARIQLQKLFNISKNISLHHSLDIGNLPYHTVLETP